MAMLAEPRRKQKIINLRAKNNAWSNDNNKFGQRMLEKMGWSAGKGLGANEDGIIEHVVAKFKNDEKGLGYEDRNDQWTKHEDDFNELLSNLSNGGDKNEEKLHSGVSLEKKSKRSKARVHYHKFTRGKDISRYSEKDLANIFGKKSLKNVESAEVLKADIQTSEQILTEKGSMEDYFKNKLQNFKSRIGPSLPEIKSQEDYEDDYVFKGFSSTNDEQADEKPLCSETLEGRHSQRFSLYSDQTNISNHENHAEVQNTKSKKKNKEKLNECIQNEIATYQKKKNKRLSSSIVSIESVEQNDELLGNHVSNNTKKSIKKELKSNYLMSYTETQVKNETKIFENKKGNKLGNFEVQQMSKKSKNRCMDATDSKPNKKKRNKK